MRPGGQLVCVGVVAGRHPPEEAQGFLSRLLAREDAVTADRYPPRLAIDAPLGEVRHGGSANSKAEPAELGVVVENLSVGRALDAINCRFREPGCRHVLVGV